MPLGSQSSADEIRADLVRAHDAVFGQRDDAALQAAIDGSASALFVLANRAFGAYETEPDFITGSSEKEQHG